MDGPFEENVNQKHTHKAQNSLLLMQWNARGITARQKELKNFFSR